MSYRITELDPHLRPYEKDIENLMKAYHIKKRELVGTGRIADFAYVPKFPSSSFISFITPLLAAQNGLIIPPSFPLTRGFKKFLRIPPLLS